MITIQTLLQRIRWDPQFARASFALGYFDRLQRCVVTVPLAQIRFEAGNHFSFTVIEEDGANRDVPFHRVREVRRDGVCIWHREVPGEAGQRGVRIPG